MRSFTRVLTGLLFGSISLFSCKSIINVQTATALGANGGEMVGEMVGKASGNAPAGAVIGESLGEVTGSVIGLKLDKQAAELKKEIKRARVARTGEQIVVEFNNKVFFQTNNAELSASARQHLDGLISSVKRYPETALKIQGHTDNQGTDSLNQSLSEQRAAAVANYLINEGVDSRRITTKGFGDSVPKYDNNSEKGRMQNRRVEVLISGAASK